MKKYIANTAISVSVSLPGGGNARVSFSALTDGSSVYYTEDKEIQWALEHHYKFGKLFRLEQTEEQNTSAKKPAAKTSTKKVTNKAAKKPVAEVEAEEAPADEETLSEEETQEESSELREVTVTDMDAAKDYLAENFDVVRTKLKTEEIINETALAYGIVFKTL